MGSVQFDTSALPCCLCRGRALARLCDYTRTCREAARHSACAIRKQCRVTTAAPYWPSFHWHSVRASHWAWMERADRTRWIAASVRLLMSSLDCRRGQNSQKTAILSREDLFPFESNSCAATFASGRASRRAMTFRSANGSLGSNTPISCVVAGARTSERAVRIFA